MEYLGTKLRKIIIICIVIAVGFGTWYYYSNRIPNSEPERADLVFFEVKE